MPSPRPALLIWNPASGGRRYADRIPEIRAILHAHGFDLTVAPTTEPGHATALAADACRRGGCDVIFGLGGDGTLREIAVALLGTAVPLAILPGGTTNVLALALGIPAHPVKAATLYRAAPPAGRLDQGGAPSLDVRALDVGIARPMGVGRCGDGAAIPFLMMVTVGVDSEILRRVSQHAKRRFGRLAVAAQALAALKTYGSPTHTLVAGERRAAGTFIAASNIRYYGGPFEITPRADPLDGRLDFAVFAGRGRLAMLELALDVLTGTHRSRADFASWQGTSARIEGEGEVWVQIDGDPMRLALPVEIALAPERVGILQPSSPGLTRRA
ncbi:MAG TPA: diacylglycerol kinase family protein [Thermoanaerobaculia bacterium]|nr:diacylglycerol kinase family protein [Thermoanaerobaculia bacterium]